MTRVETKIYKALDAAEPSVMVVRSLYRQAQTVRFSIYKQIDFDGLKIAIIARMGQEQFRAIHSFGVTGK